MTMNGVVTLYLTVTSVSNPGAHKHFRKKNGAISQTPRDRSFIYMVQKMHRREWKKPRWYALCHGLVTTHTSIMVPVQHLHGKKSLSSMVPLSMLWEPPICWRSWMIWWTVCSVSRMLSEGTWMLLAVWYWSAVVLSSAFPSLSEEDDGQSSPMSEEKK